MTDPKFVERILTPTERERALTPEYVAGRWAAKEALKKAVPALASYQDVEIVGVPGSPPEVRLANLAPGQRAMISITHETDYAAAVAIVEQS